ncbi:type I polyketide synthase [Streptomyces celluloflavus]
MESQERLFEYLKKASAELQSTRKRLRRIEADVHEPIAIVGMGCRYPGGVRAPEDLWGLVDSGTDAVGPFPADRGWDEPDAAGDADAAFEPRGGFVYEAGEFDAGFFKISPREALAMDPQQRLLLEVVWEAVERAGIDPSSLKGSRTGVFAGASSSGYGEGVVQTDPGAGAYLMTGNAASVISGRVAYTLGLTGPAVTVDTACSSSLVALHLAVQALRGRECGLALVGGVTVMATPMTFAEFARQQGLASDGRCKSFGAGADGTGWAEGAGVLVVERLSDARRAGHHVLAVIRGSAVNQDGASNGLTAPNGPSQRRVIRAALANAQLAAADIDAVEAHGTGTTLGDPIEAQALLATYGTDEGRAADRPLWLGSLKSNIGHSQQASGVAGVIKMVLALQHGVLPRTLHAEEPSPHVDWTAGKVQLLQEPVEWSAGGERTRRAGVSSFGMSGTNAHAILEEAPEASVDASRAEQDENGGDARKTDAPAVLARTETVPWLVSSRDAAGLVAQAGRLHAHILARPEVAAGDVAWSLATTRSSFEHRAVVLGAGGDDLATGLAALAAQQPAAGVVTGSVPVGRSGRTVFVFPGQGSQWVGMGRELAEVSPVFAARLGECAAALKPYVDWELDDVLAGRHGFEAADVVQPALWAVMVSLAAVWQAAGVQPDAVVGHSQGEIAAAAVAGVLSLDDAAKVVALRSKTLTALAGRGGMMSVAEAADVVRERIAPFGERLSLAAVNGSLATVVSGEPAALRELADSCPESVRTRIIPVDYASHSAQVDDLREEILSVLDGIAPREASIPMISAMTGEVLTGPELDPAYWYASLRETVEFERAVRVLAESGHGTYIEVSPHSVLTGAITDSLDEEAVVVGTLRREDGGAERLLASFAAAHVQGLPIDWPTVLGGSGRTVELPTYAFQHRRYWPKAPARADRTSIADWRYRITWSQLPDPVSGPARSGTWLLVGDGPDANVIARALTDRGARVRTAAPGQLARAADESVTGVVSLLALDEEPEGARHPWLATGAAATVALLRDLDAAGIAAPLWVLTRGAVGTGAGEAATSPAQAQTWGIGRVVALELPDRWGGLIDLPESGAWDDRAAARLAAVLADGTEDQVALRPHGLLGRRLERAPEPERAGALWTPRGTALITGGTGAIGAHTARWLSERGARRIALTSRRGPAADGVAALAAELAISGTSVDVLACDIAERCAVAGLLERIAATGPALSSVVHAAGVGTGGPVLETTADELAAGMAAKVGGARWLDELTADQDLDAFVLFSSGAAVWGSGGLSGYAAGNAHVDALAEARRARGLPATSVAWGLWDGGADGGMVGDTAGRALRGLGMRLIDPPRGIRALARAVDGDEGVLAVADIDWERFAPTFTLHRPSPLIAALAAAESGTESAADASPVAEQEAPAGALALRLAGLAAAEQRQLLTDLVRRHAAAVLGHDSADAVQAQRAFKDLGFDSPAAIDLRNRLAADAGVKLPATVIFDYPNAVELAGHLCELLLGVQDEAAADGAGRVVPMEGEPIAIIGMGCRYPGGATGPEQFWDLLATGTDAVADFPTDRGWAEFERQYGGDEVAAGRAYTRQGGFVYNAADFDASFFGISPREALSMDPQQRLLLEVAWESVEGAGFDPASLKGSSTGVFVGATNSGYAVGGAGGEDGGGAGGYGMTGGLTAVISGRISYTLGLTGPAVTVDTACSSSLVALHQAVQALRGGECTMALAGGVAVLTTPAPFMDFSQQGGMASSGRCKAFSAEADGIGWGEGAGMLVLERLSEARRNGHRVLGVIRGSAVNQDGASNGLAAPNGPSQRRVIRAALANAGLTAADVDVVEAHGTGTELGDPIEAQALLATYGADEARAADRPLWLGSVKSNVGHTGCAAGVAGVIKMVLSMQHGMLPKTLYADEPSPHVDWSAGNVRLLQEAAEWGAGERPRRAGVSAFGISGTNVHLLVEEAPAEEAAPPQPAGAALAPVLARKLPVWLLSGRDVAGLAGQAGRLRDFALARPGPAPVDVAWSLATTRSAFEHRAVVLGSAREELTAGLTAVATAQPAANVVTGSVVPSSAGRTVFVFPGQGSQWVGMGRELAEVSPAFAARLAECAAALEPYVDWELEDVLAGRHGFEAADVVQPALWAVMVSLAAVWQAAGVQPDAVVGHSQGEIAAAAVAGILSLDDAAKVVALRSRTLKVLAGRGGMMSIAEAADVVRERIAPFGERLSLAAVNGSSATVVSGEPEALRELADSCPESVRTRVIPVDYASHSAQVDDLREEILSVLDGIAPREASIPMISAMSGETVTGPELDPAYWYASLRETVEFERAVRVLAESGHGTFVEVSPHPVLTGAIADSLDEEAVVVGTLRREDGGAERLLAGFAEGYVRGVPVDWATVLGSGTTVDLPTYAFQRRRYWAEAPAAGGATAEPGDSRFWNAVERGQLSELAGTLEVDEASLGEVLPALAAWHRRRQADTSVADWRYRITWQPASEANAALSGSWLVVGDNAEAAAVAQALSARGAEVRTVADPAALDHTPAGGLRGIVSLLALDETPLADRPAVPRGTAGTLAVMKALGKAGIDAPLWVVTRGAVQTGPGEVTTSPAQAQVWGLGRAFGLEQPDRWGGLIDLPASGARDDRTADRLAAALADGREDQLALRATGTLARRLVRAEARRAGAGKPWRPRGTVLLTGGTGSIGACVATWLAERGAPRVVLTSRSGPSAPGVAQIAAAAAGAGAAVEVVGCDVADRDALAGLLARIDATGPALSTVLHSANAPFLARIADTDLAGLAFSLGTKAVGARHLDELTAGLDLDEFVMFSSISATWGSNDHGAYAAGNSYLDALAEDRRARGLPGTSIAWGVWNTRDWDAVDAQLTQRPGAVTPSTLRRQGMNFLDTDRALAALGQTLADDETFIAIADVDWEKFAPVFRAARPRPLLETVPEARDEEEPTAGQATALRGELATRLAGQTPAERQRTVVELVRAQAAAVLGHGSAADVPSARAFKDLGFDSLTAVELRRRLNSASGLRLPATVVFDYPNPTALAKEIVERFCGSEPVAGAAASVAATAAAASAEPIAIVGMACRYAGGVRTPDELWQLLAAGGDAISGFPADRGWDVEGLLDPDPDKPGTTYASEGGFLSGAADFDAGFFGISPREALAMDPQQRLLLETSWEAIEGAGIDPEALRSTPVGVYAGAAPSGYFGAGTDTTGSEVHLITGNALSVLSGRVSYTLGLEGPAVTLDTACSSSLVALHQAAQALRTGECSMALAGGVTVMANLVEFVGFSRQRALAADGRCKAFGDGADGMGIAEGAGMVVLERLSEARRKGHQVLGVIAGSAVNQDGASNGLAAPNGPAQQRVIRAALANAGLVAADVDVVEAHGTGTELGDPIEAQALLATYGQERPDAGSPLWLGSVKSNIGHAQQAAGVAGVIKMILAMRHGVLPRTLFADTPSSHVDWSAGNVQLLQEPVEWGAGERVRRAGVSAFGISGTNVHLILEEAPAEQPETTDVPAEPAAPVLDGTPTVPWPVSGRDAAGLAGQAGRLREFALAQQELAAGDVAWSLATTRTAFEHRAVVLGTGREELTAGLVAVATGRPAGNVVTGSVTPGGVGRTVFVFPGQGSQWVGMGRELAEVSPVFAARLAECAAALKPYVKWELADVLAGRHGFEAADVVQPALWAVMVSLAAVWQAAGVQPDAVVGHSQGEIAAAAVAGILSLDDAAKVVALRSKTLTALAGRGGMVSIAEAADVVRERIAPFGERLSLAAVNGPSATVVSGEPTALRELADSCPESVRTRLIPVDYASHSAQVDDLREEILSVLEGIKPSEATIPMISAMTGEMLTGPELDPAYWYASLRETVEFDRAVRVLADKGHGTYIEVSPHPVLTGALVDTLAEGPADEPVVVGTLRREDGGAERLLDSLAGGFVRGLPVDWAKVLGRGTTVKLPTYAFQHRHYWPENVDGPATTSEPTDSGLWRAIENGELRELAASLDVEDASLGQVLPVLDAWRRRNEADSSVADWRYRISWAPVPDRDAAVLSGTWLLVGSSPEIARALADRGAEVVTAEGPDALDRVANPVELTGVVSVLALEAGPLADGSAVPRGTADTLALVQALDAAGMVAPLWVLTRGAVGTGPGEAVTCPAQAQVWGLGQVTALELPERWGGLIDLPREFDARAAVRLTAVLADGGEDQVALRARGVLARRLVRAGQPRRDGVGWRPRGTVLVTGGTGGVGGITGRWLAERGAARVVLTSRSGPAAAGVPALAADLAGAGSTVEVVGCDIADRDAVGALLSRIDATGPALSSVVHSAGVGGTKPVSETDADDLASIFAAKVHGAMVLDELTSDRDLDAFVMYSSGAGVWGSGGLSAYAAANAHLDALCDRRRARGLVASSVAWGLWAGVGMAAGSEGERLRDFGMEAIDAERGMRALGQVLDAGEGAVAVAGFDWAQFAPTFTLRRRSPLLTGLPEVQRLLEAGAAIGVEESGSGLAGRVAGMPVGDQRQLLTDLVRRHAAAVLGHDSAEPVEPQRAFKDLGFDSAGAVELRNRLSSAAGVKLPATMIFDYPNAAALAEYVRGELVGADGASDGDTVDPVLDGLDRLEAALAAAGGGGARQDVTDRLRTLLSRWLDDSGPQAESEGDEQQSMDGRLDDEASAGEVLDFINKELGLS